VLQASTLTLDEPDRCELRTPFLYIESRGERQLTLAGTTEHRLVKVGRDWRIRLKRVNLLDAGTALPAIQLFP
jgi:3-phenylpropionate/cinnamic acid dioxygenase small subunit